jgi:hypothetical protein
MRFQGGKMMCYERECDKPHDPSFIYQYCSVGFGGALAEHSAAQIIITDPVFVKDEDGVSDKHWC